LALAQAIVKEAGKHEVWLALNARLPDSIDALRAAFIERLPPERIRVFELPGPVAELDLDNSWRTQAAELVREKYLADLSPDVVHLSTFFEGVGDDVVASIGRLDQGPPTAVTLYDLIPMLRPESYLTDPKLRRSYLRRVQSLRRADLLLAISESSGREAIEVLQISPERIAVIGTGLRQAFQEIEICQESRLRLLAQYGLQRPFVHWRG
jgi:hypothetical protein